MHVCPASDFPASKLCCLVVPVVACTGGDYYLVANDFPSYLDAQVSSSAAAPSTLSLYHGTSVSCMVLMHGIRQCSMLAQQAARLP